MKTKPVIILQMTFGFMLHAKKSYQTLLQRWRLSRAFPQKGGVYRREKETKRKRDGATAWGTKKQRGWHQGKQRNRPSSLIENNAHTRGLCVSAQKGGMANERGFLWVRRSQYLIDTTIFQYIATQWVLWFNILWGTMMYWFTSISLPQICQRVHVKCNCTLSVKRHESGDMAPCFSTSEVPFQHSTLHFHHFISPLSTYVVRVRGRTFSTLWTNCSPISFLWSTSKKTSWSKKGKKSGFKVWWYSSEAKCISVSHAPQLLRKKEMCKHMQKSSTSKKRLSISRILLIVTDCNTFLSLVYRHV